ncbi:ATP-binding protein [Crossiella cryophila]|uniref:Tetratricopeptide (TPR) repeat protein n=1 Tax=Crossiella cryophila TaxID=43355 RepID=A0A7W7FTW7_9PSEU|nr:tetratricopeptide repeat protein [Crossiella cryophila]MBB4677450.1 tetratricopeptide (TPR) repeat protein [Crossiella cryophila]
MDNNAMSGVTGNVVQAATIVGGVHIHATDEARSVPRQLPALARGFTGREPLLATIDEAMGNTPPDTVPVVVLSGMGGVGKTALAVSWASAAAERFPGGQLYVDLRGYGPDEPLPPGEVLGGFLRALGMAPEWMPTDTGQRASTFRSLVAGRQVLVLLDNARDAEQVRPLLPGPGSSVIVTSRSPLTGLVVTQGATPVPVDVLGTEEALALLRTLLGPQGEEEPHTVATLARHCTHLPLALRVVAGLVRSVPARPLAEVAATLIDEHRRLDSLDVGDPRTAVRTVFSWSYHRLPAHQARMFRLLGRVPGATAPKQALAALAGVSLAVADRLLEALAEAQLVTATANHRIGMHDLLRLYASELVERDDGDERFEATTRLFDHYLHGTDQADRLLTPNRFRIPLEGLPREVPSFPDQDAALAWMVAEQEVLTGLLQLEDYRLDVRSWQLAYTMRGYFFLTKDWDAWIRTHELALTATVRLKDRKAEASTRNNLSMALLERGSVEAAERHCWAALQIFDDLGDLRGAGNALGNCAWVLHRRGDHEGALEQVTRALGNYHRCGARTNAGITLRSIAIFETALGRYEIAIRHIHEAMAIFEERSSLLNMAMALNCLGETHHQSGDLRAADQAHEEAITLARAQGSAFEEARAHHGRARVAVLFGDHEQAVTEFEAALELFTRLSAFEGEEVAAELTRLRP